MIVITLTNAKPSLRGDLTKWFQEVQTGVYVGNVSARIRDKIWDRILENIGNGTATIIFNAQNELGYTFRSTRPDYIIQDFDGIPLLKKIEIPEEKIKYGFSKASKYRKIKKYSHKSNINEKNTSKSFISLDIETTGLDVERDSILSIGAVKFLNDEIVDTFNNLIKVKCSIRPEIQKLTGIDKSEIEENGKELDETISEFSSFVENFPCVGYNVNFDYKFLDEAFVKVLGKHFNNKLVDLMPLVKKENIFLDNYRLKTVLENYNIQNNNPHNSYSDANSTLKLAIELIKKGLVSF